MKLNWIYLSLWWITFDRMGRGVWDLSLCYIKQLLYDAKIHQNWRFWVFFFFILEQDFFYFGQESVFIQQSDGDFIATQWVASAANTSFGKQRWAKDNNTLIKLTGTCTPPERVLNQSRYTPFLESHQIGSRGIKRRSRALQNKSWRGSQRFAFFHRNLSQFDFHALLK